MSAKEENAGRVAGLLAFVSHVASLPNCAISQSLRADARQVLDAYAKPAPTLRECEDRLSRLWGEARANRADGRLSDALDEWVAAIERERR